MMNTSEQIFFTANYTMYKIYMYKKKDNNNNIKTIGMYRNN